MTPTTAHPYLFPPPYTVPLTYSRILPVPPPPTYDGPGTAYGQPFLTLTEILPTSSGRPLSALAVVFRAPSPYPSFARFPPFPLLGGVIAEPGIRLVGIFAVLRAWDILSSSVTD
jgi:hypothetical protein